MSGPCVRQVVTATIIAVDGRRFVSTNFCRTPQTICPRADMPTGVGYELCKSVCDQPAHAEINALELAGPAAEGGSLYLEGHTYICGPCGAAAAAAGIGDMFVCAPPAVDSWQDARDDEFDAKWNARLEP